jgi:hypothetical protein
MNPMSLCLNLALSRTSIDIVTIPTDRTKLMLKKHKSLLTLNK